jgi:hypothetical protein
MLFKSTACFMRFPKPAHTSREDVSPAVSDMHAAFQHKTLLFTPALPRTFQRWSLEQSPQQIQACRSQENATAPHVNDTQSIAWLICNMFLMTCTAANKLLLLVLLTNLA